MSPDLSRRIVADARDRVAWTRARSRGITATDVAGLSSAAAVTRVARDKLGGSRFSGNAYTVHGRRREPQIARWVAATHGIEPSTACFHAPGERRHLATPDGLAEDPSGRIVLCEIKTTSKPWRSIPRSYLRQVWWQQYVLGAERTLVVWEQHDGFVPTADEPRSAWVDRDAEQIQALIGLAGAVIDELHRHWTTGRPAGEAASRSGRRALALTD